MVGGSTKRNFPLPISQNEPTGKSTSTPTNVQLSQDKSGKDYWLKYAKKKNEGGYHRTLNKGKRTENKTTEMIGLKAGS